MKTPLRNMVIAAFAEEECFLGAVDRFLNDRNWRLYTYTPHSLEALDARLDLRPSPIPKIIFIAFVLGALGGYGMQAYASVFSYPLNIGGRPLHSWPAFIPVTFELGVLTAALTGMAALFIRQRWPRLHLPDLDSPLICRGSLDRYVLALEWTGDAADPQFLTDMEQRLREWGAVETEEYLS